MARAGAAAVLALAVCCLLVFPAPARRPADLPPRALHAVADREAAAEPLRPKPADCADAAEAEQATAVAVTEEDPAREEEPQQQRSRSSSLLCLVFRCGGEPARVSGPLVARTSSEEPQALDEGTWPAGPGRAEAEDEDERPYDNDTDWDSDRDSDDDSDSDSDDEGEEGGVLGWLWRLADRF